MHFTLVIPAFFKHDEAELKVAPVVTTSSSKMASVYPELILSMSVFVGLNFSDKFS